MGKKKQRGPLIPEVIIISDPNADVDDLVSYVTASMLADRGQLNLKGVIATTGDMMIRLRRAMFAKGCFIGLGYPFLKICAGMDYPRRPVSEYDDFYGQHQLCESFERQGAVVERNAMRLWQGYFAKAQDKSLTVVVNAQMYDLAFYLRSCGVKNLKKIAKIIVMGGGVLPEAEDGMITPDMRSYNNAVCETAAEEVFKTAQENNIRLVLVPKEAVYQVQVGRDFYERMEKLKNPVAQMIAATNKLFLENLWEAVRRGDYSHFDMRRFAKVFMGKDYRISSRIINGRKSFADIWPHICYFNLYDALSVLVSAEAVFKKFGRFERLSQKYPVFQIQIEDAEGLRKEMTDLIFEKLNPVLTLKQRLAARSENKNEQSDAKKLPGTEG